MPMNLNLPILIIRLNPLNLLDPRYYYFIRVPIFFIDLFSSFPPNNLHHT
jgi:hypothetical protein